MILAIDPGPEKSAWIVYHPELREIGQFAIGTNYDVLATVGGFYGPGCRLAIEMIASYGMSVGQSVFDTARWVGRFQQQALIEGSPVFLVYRKDVKKYLCHHSHAKDGNIRQAVIDRFPASGGGKVPQIGTKKSPGPLYGVSKDVWQALGVAITHAEDY